MLLLLLQLRRGILITEVDELLLPPELAEPGADDASTVGTVLSGATGSSGGGGGTGSSLRDAAVALRHGLTPGGTGGTGHHSAKQVAKQLQYKLADAGDRLLISAGKKLGMSEQLAARGREGGAGGGRGDSGSSSGAATLKALQAQLMEGRLDLQQLDFQALVAEVRLPPSLKYKIHYSNVFRR
jgi:hypothetical protein